MDESQFLATLLPALSGIPGAVGAAFAAAAWLRAQIAGLRAEIAMCRADVAGIRTEQRDHAAAQESLTADVKALQTRIDSLWQTTPVRTMRPHT